MKKLLLLPIMMMLISGCGQSKTYEVNHYDNVVYSLNEEDLTYKITYTNYTYEDGNEKVENKEWVVSSVSNFMMAYDTKTLATLYNRFYVYYSYQQRKNVKYLLVLYL